MKKLTGLLMLMCLILAFAIPASALEYHIDAPNSFEYGRATSVEPVVTADKGEMPNVDLSKNAALIPPAFGSPSSYLPGSGEALTPNLTGTAPSTGITGAATSAIPPAVNSGYISTSSNITGATSHTAVTTDMYYSGGHIGTVKIPSLGISLKVWQGETNDSMAKGLGHYTSTSAWDGNVGVCGHNRGTRYVIGSIKDLKIGDTITYTTVYGTRTYAVSFVGTISNTDWSYLQSTPDNRITLTTCLANHPESRVCVQAMEVIC